MARELEITVEVQQAEAQTRLRSTEDAFQRTEDAARNLGVAVDKTDAALVDHAKQLSAVERAAKNLGLTVEEYRKQLKTETDAAVDAARAEKELGKTIGETEKETKKGKESVKAYGDEVDETGKKKKKAKTATDELKDAVKGFIAVGALMSAIKAATDYAGSLDNMSKSSGLTITFLQKSASAAKANGADVSQVVSVYGRFQDAIVGGDKSVVTALGKLGLSMDALRELSPDEQMRVLAQAITSVEDPTLKANIATDLFGSTGRDLIPTLADIAGKWGQLPAIAEDNIRATAELGNRWDSLKQTGVILLVQVLGPLAEAFSGADAQMVDLTKVVPFLQATFQGLVVEVYKVAKGVVDLNLATAEYIALVPGLRTLYGVSEAGLKAQREQSQWLGDTIKGLETDLKKQWDTLQNGAKATTEVATATATVRDRYEEARKALALLTPEQKKAIDHSRALGDNLKEQAAAGKTTEEVVRLYTASLREGAKATRDHERELAKLAETKAAKAMELLAKDVQAAYDRGLTAKEIYDAFGGKLLQAGRDANTFRIELQKIAPVLDTTIQAAQEFKIAEILARANQDMQKELGRVLKDQTQIIDADRKDRESKEFDSNKRVLQNYEDIEEAKARATADRARGTMRESEAEANYKIFQLDRWRAKELQSLDASSKDYGLLASQIEEIYGVELQAVMDDYAAKHRTFWQRLKDGAGEIYQGLVGSISGHFASMLTFAEGFKEGFVGIWHSIRDTFTNILADMLDYYLKRFIARLVLGMGGGGGGVTGAILNAAGLGGGGGGVGGAVTGGAQQAGTNWLMSALGLGGGGAIAGTTSLAGAAALMPALASGGLGAAGAGLGATSLAGVSGTMPALGSVLPGLAGGGLSTVGLLGGAGAGAAGLGLGLLGTKLFGGAGWAASGFGAGTGAATGAAIGSIVPGIGTAIGALVGGVAGLIGGWLGKSKGEKINDARDEFLGQFGGAGTGTGSGFANVSAETARMDRLGMTGAETWRLIFQPKDWDDFNAGVKRLQAAFEDLRFVQDKVNESYAILQANGQKAMEQGASEVEVLKAQSAGYSEIYNTIIRTGAEAPAGFEPVAQKLLEMGLLLDANGQKVENLYGLYESNAKRMVADTEDVNGAFERLQGQQQELIDKGIEHEDVLRIQAGGYSMLLDTIKSTGGQAPEAMRPILDELLSMGLLVDKAGNKVTDLGGIFAETGSQGAEHLGVLSDAVRDTTAEAETGAKWWEKYRDRGVYAGGGIADSLKGLTDTARDVVDDMQRTFDEFQPRPVRIPTEWGMPEQPEMVAHAGGYVDYSGLKRFHRGGGLNADERLIIGQTGEGIVSRRGMANLDRLNRGDGLGGGLVIQKGAIVVNGADDPEAVAEAIMRKLRRKMKVQAA